VRRVTSLMLPGEFSPEMLVTDHPQKYDQDLT
jgi:hypothetical protein